MTNYPLKLPPSCKVAGKRFQLKGCVAGVDTQGVRATDILPSSVEISVLEIYEATLKAGAPNVNFRKISGRKTI